MRGFFYPKRVVVIGVSSRSGNLGQKIIRNLLNYQFRGEIIPVGPRGGVVFGFAIHESVLDVPGIPDMAVILTPAAAVPELLEQCGIKGIKRVVIESGGFAEFDKKGRELSDRLVQIASKYSIRIIGPNGIGVANRHLGLAVPFATLPKPAPGPISIISQSGGVGVTYCNEFVSEHLGLSKFTSMGNKIDVGEVDLIDYLAKDKDTGVILAYLESIGDGRALFDVAVECKKPLIIHKANIGKTSHKIAASHSSAMMTDDKVVKAMFMQAGIVRSKSRWQSMAASKIFTLPPMKGDRIAIVSRSGGHAVVAADVCHMMKLKLPQFPKKFVQEIESHVRAGVINLQNPLDLGDLFDMEVYQVIMEKIIRQKDIDGVLFLFMYYSDFDPQVPERIIDFLQHLCDKYKKPVALVLDSWAGEVRRLKQYSHFPIFNSPDEAAWALAESWFHVAGQESAERKPRRPKGIRKTQIKDRIKKFGSKPKKLNAEAFALLKSYGIPYPKMAMAKDYKTAAAFAKKAGYPVAAKIESDTLTHKTDVGGVALNILGPAELKKTISGWKKEFGKALSGVLVQPMAKDGPELILGARQDPQFGPLVMLGWGGTMAEMFEEPEIRLAPITLDEAKEMVASLPGQKVLAGYRGGEKVSVRAIADALVRIGWMISDNALISELDINPLRVYGDGVLALDVRIMLR